MDGTAEGAEVGFTGAGAPEVERALARSLAKVDAAAAKIVTHALARVQGAPRTIPLAPLFPTSGVPVEAVVDRALADARLFDVSPRIALHAALEIVADALGARDAAVRAGAGDECLAALGEGRSRRFAAVSRQAIDDDDVGRSGKRLPLVACPVRVAGVAAAALVLRLSDSSRIEAAESLLPAAAARLSAHVARDRLATDVSRAGAELADAVERRLVRMAYDLHDGPLQELAALGEELRFVTKDVSALVSDDSRPAVLESLGSLHEQAAHLEADLREIAQSLEGAHLSRPSLETLLAREQGVLSRRHAIQLDYEVPSLDGLSHSQQIVLYRCVQEALANVARHSGARSATVHVDRGPSGVVATIVDDGCGIDLDILVSDERKRERLGIVGMQARARLLGGEVAIRSRPGEGTTIAVALPPWEPEPAPGADAPDYLS